VTTCGLGVNVVLHGLITRPVAWSRKTPLRYYKLHAGPKAPTCGHQHPDARGAASLEVGPRVQIINPYTPWFTIVYSSDMDVGVSELRAHLSEWLERAREGQEVVVTDRGLPVARLVGIEATTLLERLTAEGVIARPHQSKRPTAAGRSRPRARRSVADVVSEQRP